VRARVHVDEGDAEIGWRFFCALAEKPGVSDVKEVTIMPKANDLEGAQDQGGKHGGQAGMPKSEKSKSEKSKSEESSAGKVVGDRDPRHGIVRDKLGEDQPADRDRARQ
jgi:hypothetical protein